MNRKRIFFLSFVAITTVFFITKKLTAKPEIITVDPAFAQYVSGYTSGMLSRTSTIKIELASELPIDSNYNDANKIPLPDSNLLKNVITFSPSIKGKTRFISNRVIEFIPDEPLKEQTLYTATFKLSKLVDVESDCKKMRFQFSTYSQTMSVDLSASQNIDDYNIEWQTITANVKLSDEEDTLKLYKTIKAVQNGNKLKIKWNKIDATNYTVLIDSIVRTTEKGKVLISWNGKPISAKESGNKEIIIPALGDFVVTDAKVNDDENSSVTLTFSDPIKQDQDLNGLITLSNNEALTYSIEQNTVKVFLAERIIGNYMLNVASGVKNFKGYAMNTTYSTTLEFEPPKPQVIINGKGSILPNSQGLFFPFESIGLKSVDVRIIKIYSNNIKQFLQVNDLDGDEGLKRVGKTIVEKNIKLPDITNVNINKWTQHVIDLKKLIIPDPGSIYRISIKFKKEYTNFDCPVNDEENDEFTDDEEAEENKDWTEDEWHGYSYDYGYDTWSGYGDNYSPCDNNYYDGKAVSRNILASDIGIVYKIDDDKTAHVYVSNMLTTEPINNTEIEFSDYTNQTIVSGKTNENGMFDVKLTRKPFLIIAKQGSQRGYLKVKESNANSLSIFDIEGEQYQKGVKGYIYAERGVWRPGDSLFLTFILEDKLHTIPDNHPVKFELTNPSGTIIYETTSTKSVDKMYDFRCATTSNAPTGNYMATVTIGNNVFNKRINVETVKPNRLKINLTFPDSVLSANNKNQKVQLQSKWLHGGVAKNLNVTVSAVISATETSFKKYQNYIFQSPLKQTISDEITVFNGALNENGTVDFEAMPTIPKDVSGIVKATYVTKVFEQGGDFSIDRAQVLVSPFNRYVGLQTPSNSSQYEPLATNKKQLFRIVTVDEKGNAAKVNQLHLRIYKLNWQWWYERDEDDLSNFVAKNATSIIKDSMIMPTDANADFSMTINDKNWGRYLITVTDVEGGHQTGSVVFFDMPYWNRESRSNTENATMLNFSTDKPTYKTGEKIKVSIPTSAKGKVLVSVENATKVLQSQWINATAGETKYEFTATANMTPNVFIHITYLQPHINTVNDLPIRLYGIIPITIVDENTFLHPVIETPNTAKPEQNMVVNIKEQNGKKMSYTLEIVDDGLLDLTHFKTPNAWNTFYAKQALGVKTWDMYDAVIGAYSGKLDKMISIGGDGEYQDEYANKANRFIPMVKHLGPFILEKGQTATHKIPIPNYIGSVRVMVVAQHDGSYGNAQKEVAIKKPLMLLATLPRVFSPTEEIELPVDIFAMENFVKDVNVSIETNDFIEVGNKQQSIHFSNIGDEIVNFKLKIKNKIGVAKVKIKATSGKETAYQEIEIDVRMPNPMTTQTNEFVLEPGKSSTQPIQFFGIDGTNSATVELSTIPSIGLETRLNYLIQYPHGCIEQTTSSVFPQLFINNLMNLSDSLNNQITENIKKGIKRIQLFQTTDGGFSYWPGESEASEFGSNYAGHFLIEAEKKGYVIPVALKSNWLKYQKERAKKWNESTAAFVEIHDEESYQFLQAYRLYTLALNNTPEIGAMNQLREFKNLKPSAKWRLAAAYKLIGQFEVANSLVKNLSLEIANYRELSYAYGSAIRDKAMILETLVNLKDEKRSAILVNQIMLALNKNNWMSTQETAYCLLALCKYYNTDNSNITASVLYGINNATSKTLTIQKKIGKLFLSETVFSKAKCCTD
ncbi:MAG: MG2 domain-containing protein [Chitinophagales bacterium]